MSRIRTVPPVYALGFAALMWGLDRLSPVSDLVPAPFNAIGVPVGGTGVLIAVWAAYLFRRRRTTLNPHAESSRLVTEGPFRFTRNPMYVGLLFGLAGYALWLGSLSPLLLLPVFVWLITHHFIVNEEQRLERLFGATYQDYCGRVPRWLWPDAAS